MITMPDCLINSDYFVMSLAFIAGTLCMSNWLLGGREIES